jgi:predicted dehydrogenase
MNQKIKWGIIGLGHIAHNFAEELINITDVELVAVASRTLDKAEEFAVKYCVSKAYGSYDEIINDPNVDILYIATPHNSHAQIAIQALQNNKHVLCEKPIALHYKDALQMVATAKKYNNFLMEAFWTRFNPTFREVLQKVKNGEIGTVNYINADFAFQSNNLEKGRMVELALGGGALMDIGVYPLFLTYIFLGMPKEILAKANFHPQGADMQTSMLLQYDTAQAVLYAGLLSNSNMKASIMGTKGRININRIWHMAQSYTLIKDNQETTFDLPTIGRGFTYEILECNKCLRENKIESPDWSHQNSLDLMQIIESVKKEIGLEYAVE